MTRLTVTILAVFIFALDRVTKLWAVHRLSLDQSGITLIPRLLYFSRTSNTGSAFGLFAHSTVILAAASLAAAVAISVYIARQHRPLPAILGIGLALPLGGALGNCYDRALHGSVVDFILVQLGSYSWPIFNVADSAICIGVALIALSTFRAAAGDYRASAVSDSTRSSHTNTAPSGASHEPVESGT